MSEKKIAASTPYRRTGCSVISMTSSGFMHDSSIPTPSRSLRYSGSDRPAWRMNQTGVCGTGSPRAALRNALIPEPRGVFIPEASQREQWEPKPACSHIRSRSPDLL